jgi:hypothetical protein
MGCHKSVQTFSEDESIIYLLNMLKNFDSDIPKKWSDLLPDFEDIIIEYAKNQTYITRRSEYIEPELVWFCN